MSEHCPGLARFYLPLIIAAGLLLAVFVVVKFAAPARALPSFARQTGQPCGTCHTDFAGLTPYGRRFKINGYTNGGGQYRTTLFSFDNSTADYQRPWVPPISMMAIPGFTHTEPEMAPPADPFANNDNISIPPLSFFWGGAITDHIGAFAQLTYSQEPSAAGIGNDPFVHAWSWDNTDVRYADSTTLGKMSITYGITANNNPTVQDPWNTTPAWAFPYAVSPFGAGFGPGPIIDGAFAAHAGSVGGYVYIRSTSRRPSIARLVLAHRMLSVQIHSARRDYSMQRHIGALPLNRIGALIGSRLERLAWLPTSILLSIRVHPTLRLFRRPTNSPISAWTPNISIRAAISGSRCAAAIFTNTRSWMRASPI